MLCLTEFSGRNNLNQDIGWIMAIILSISLIVNIIKAIYYKIIVPIARLIKVIRLKIEINKAKKFSNR